MKIYYEESDLVSFGEYLLSEERQNRILNDHDETSLQTYEEALLPVYDADLANWKEKLKTV